MTIAIHRTRLFETCISGSCFLIVENMDCGSSLNVLIIKCHIIMLIAAVIAPREEINELSLRPDTDRYKVCRVCLGSSFVCLVLQ